MGLRLIGPYHIGDGVYANSSQKLDLNMRYTGLKGFSWSVDLFNALNSKDSDIEYWYASQLQTEDAPVLGRHVHPFVPRSVRIKVSYEY